MSKITYVVVWTLIFSVGVPVSFKVWISTINAVTNKKECPPVPQGQYLYRAFVTNDGVACQYDILQSEDEGAEK
jgi:hypothetical protein